MLSNGIGGFSMGTVAGCNMRRYHGLLVAATKPPSERMVLFANLEAYVTLKGTTYGLSTNQYQGAIYPTGYTYLDSFSVGEHASWIFQIGEHKIEKRVKIHKGKNAVTVEYENLGSAFIQLSLRPLVCHRGYHENFSVTDFYPQFLVFPEDRTILEHNDVKLVLEHPGADRSPTTGWYYRFEHLRESDRGLNPAGDLYCPCELRYTLDPGQVATLVASTEEFLKPATFVDEPSTQGATTVELLKQSALLNFVESEDRETIIAGYPWFTDWGRDTMISLPGLCLATKSQRTARNILSSYASFIRQGLIPNRFSDQSSEPEYNTVDATLWFANCIYLSLDTEWDFAFASESLNWLAEIFVWHQQGTLHGIQMDPEDALLTQGEAKVQLTWMDAKVGDWVVTPRHGKPVEVNGLWINFLRVYEWLGQKLGAPLPHVQALAEKAEQSFRSKFWKAHVGHFLDTVDPDDASLRPNQLIAMSLPFGPAQGKAAQIALEAIKSRLLTPYGLRSLGPNEPGYQPRYAGNMVQRDSAYHQGTVWPWLLGPYVESILKVNGDILGAKQALSASHQLLESYGLGGIAEVYDAEHPYTPGGCPWQAWSVCEILRAHDLLEKFEESRNCE